MPRAVGNFGAGRAERGADRGDSERERGAKAEAIAAVVERRLVAKADGTTISYRGGLSPETVDRRTCSLDWRRESSS